MLSFSLTLDTVLSNRRIAISIVTEKVTVIARMTMVTIIPTEIFRFIGLPLSEQKHHSQAPHQREHEHPCQHETAQAQQALTFIFLHA